MNTSVRLAVIGDTHLGRPRDLCHREEVSAWVSHVVAAAVGRGCEALLFTGDLFDRRSVLAAEPNLQAAITLLTEAAARLPVALVWGNHDLASTLSAQLPEIPGLWVAPTTPAVLPLARVDIVGASVAQDRDSRDLLDQFPAPTRPTVGLLHTSLDGFADTSVSLPATPSALAATGYRAWAFGHIHQPVLRRDDPPMFYPGAPWRMRQPGFVELTVPMGPVGEEGASARQIAVAF